MKRHIDATHREARRRRGIAPATRDRAEAAVRAEHPDADRIRIGLYGDWIYAEVWHGKHADIVDTGVTDDEPLNEPVSDEAAERRREAGRKAAETRRRRASIIEQAGTDKIAIGDRKIGIGDLFT